MRSVEVEVDYEDRVHRLKDLRGWRAEALKSFAGFAAVRATRPSKRDELRKLLA